MTTKLDSDIDVEVEQLSDQYGSEFEGEVLGYGVMYSAGADYNCLVDREWLLDTAEALNIPDDLLPRRVSPYYAYKRTIKRMQEDWVENMEVEVERKDGLGADKHTTVVDIRKGDGSNVWHVSADVLYTEEETDTDGGIWESTDLGYFIYNTDEKRLKAHRRDELEEGHELEDLWKATETTAKRYFEEMQEVHHSTDIREMMYKAVNTYTESTIKLRRSVYLFPAGMGDFLDSMAQLYSEINERFKETGEPMAIRTFEILNTEEKRDWIQHKVESTLEDTLDDLLDEAFDSLDDGETSSEVVEGVIDQLGETDTTAETYSSLLEAEISVEMILEDKKQEIADGKREEMVEAVIDELDI